MLFSQRKGYKPISEFIQHEGMSIELRNTLWNILDNMIWQSDGFTLGYIENTGMKRFSHTLWFRDFKIPTDTRSDIDETNLKKIRDYFFSCEWFEVYDFIEFILNYFENDHLKDNINYALEAELSPYRFIDNVFSDITNEHEIVMLEEALNNDDFPGVAEHLRQALVLLSNREEPDYRNSIKEAISAVESLARTIIGDQKASLGDALKIIKKEGKIHPALINAFSSFYGYASDEDGIRHGMVHNPNLTAAEAKFLLMSCTSIINYLKSKL